MKAFLMEFETHGVNELENLDDATAALVLQLQAQDLEELFSANKGKGRDGQYSDADIAVTTYQQELQDGHRILADRWMSRSLTRAVIADAALLRAAIADEETAASDRDLAHRFAGLDAPCAAVEQTADALDDGFVSRLTALYVSSATDDVTGLRDHGPSSAGSLAWTVSKQLPYAIPYLQCTICDSNTPLSNVFQTPCGHHYCQECLHTLFEMSTSDENLFPPRCCRQKIPLPTARLYLSPKLVQTFEKKSIEFKTSDRTYCSQPTCSTFIASAHIAGEQATCTACTTKTCTICKNESHDGDCPEDTATQQVLDTAREQGWQRCYNCRRVVELDVGCNHMV